MKNLNKLFFSFDNNFSNVTKSFSLSNKNENEHENFNLNEFLNLKKKGLIDSIEEELPDIRKKKKLKRPILIKKKEKQIIQKGSSPVDLCLYALSFESKQRNPELLNYIVSYLKSLKSFMNIISKEKNRFSGEQLMEEISLHLRYEHVLKNNVIIKYGEKGEKFYIILKGKLSFLIPQLTKCYLNKEEYINYLMKLRLNNEKEILSNLLIENKSQFHIEGDNFDNYIYNELMIYKKFKSKKNNEKQSKFNYSNKKSNKKNYDDVDKNSKDKNESKKKKFFSKETYKKMQDLLIKIQNKEIKSFIDETTYDNSNSPNKYIQKTCVPEINTEEKEERKYITIYNYQNMNSLESGQTFGFIALESKNCKRQATAITVEDCELGVLTKAEYLQFLARISNKEKENLFNLLCFYNILSTISQNRFNKKYSHMFEYVRFNKNHLIMDENKNINSVTIFSSGKFKISICKNLIELNDLITKIRKIRGNILGLTIQKIESQLIEQKQNLDLLKKKTHMPAEYNNELIKKNNFILSIVSEHLAVGFPDTVDPVTHLPLFECLCISAESDGYEIKYQSIDNIEQDNINFQTSKHLTLIKIEYNLKRLIQFKDEIIQRIQDKELAMFCKKEEKNSLDNIELNPLQILQNDDEKNNEIKKDEKEYSLRRNSIYKRRKNNNDKLFQNSKLNLEIIENILNNLKIKNTGKTINGYINDSRIFSPINIFGSQNKNRIPKKNKCSSFKNILSSTIEKLRRSISIKEKNLLMKKEESLKYIKKVNRYKKLMQLRMENLTANSSNKKIELTDLYNTKKYDDTKFDENLMTINNRNYFRRNKSIIHSKSDNDFKIDEIAEKHTKLISGRIKEHKKHLCNRIDNVKELMINKINIFNNYYSKDINFFFGKSKINNENNDSQSHLNRTDSHKKNIGTNSDNLQKFTIQKNNKKIVYLFNSTYNKNYNINKKEEVNKNNLGKTTTVTKILHPIKIINNESINKNEDKSKDRIGSKSDSDDLSDGQNKIYSNNIINKNYNSIE